jgi:hypothetical protein
VELNEVEEGEEVKERAQGGRKGGKEMEEVC